PQELTDGRDWADERVRHQLLHDGKCFLERLRHAWVVQYRLVDELFILHAIGDALREIESSFGLPFFLPALLEHPPAALGNNELHELERPFGLLRGLWNN